MNISEQRLGMNLANKLPIDALIIGKVLGDYFGNRIDLRSPGALEDFKECLQALQELNNDLAAIKNLLPKVDSTSKDDPIPPVPMDVSSSE